MFANSKITPEKIHAYLSTHYRVGFCSAVFVLRIEEHSCDLERLYLSSGQSCGVFITAFNPFGQPQSTEANEAAHARLGDHLREAATHVIEEAGADPTGEWPPEKRYFALGIDEENARKFGNLYDQDALVWTGEDAVPKLIFLR